MRLECIRERIQRLILPTHPHPRLPNLDKNQSKETGSENAEKKSAFESV